MEKHDIITERLKDGEVAVLGFGISNRPLVEFLLGLGCRVNVRDAKSEEALGEDCLRMKTRGVNFILGDGYLDGIYEKVIFRSPGIRPDSGSIPAAVANGSVLTSEMEYFLSLTPAYVIAVTGSDGKTTTTTLIYKLLEEEFKNTERNVYVGGNIGSPLLPLVNEMTEKDLVVVELSSFQLQTMRSHIDRAVITNITPNHLNWHTDMEEYASAKANIFAGPSMSHLTVNAADERTFDYGVAFEKERTFFSYKHIPEQCYLFERTSIMCAEDGYIVRKHGADTERIVAISDIKLPGAHNVENYMAAISATEGLATSETVTTIAKTFGGVEHRLEFVREFKGVKYYNSSIDSSPTRTAAALSALKDKPIVICGGYDKNIPFEPLAEALANKSKAVVLTGATRVKILDAISGCAAFDRDAIPVHVKEDFRDAVILARDIAKCGDTVLLSPACASFDAFPNFEVRGNAFKGIVNDFE